MHLLLNAPACILIEALLTHDYQALTRSDCSVDASPYFRKLPGFSPFRHPDPELDMDEIRKRFTQVEQKGINVKACIAELVGSFIFILLGSLVATYTGYYHEQAGE